MLSKSPSLRALNERLQALQSLLGTVRGELPAPLGAHCGAVIIREGCLVIHAESPAWASRLRFEAPHLRERLAQRHGIRVKTVRIKVLPPDVAPAGRTLPGPLRLSEKNADLLRLTAETITDARLKDALLRLSHSGRNPTPAYSGRASNRGRPPRGSA